MRWFVLVILTTIALNGYSQRLVDREGIISFYSSAPLEDIRAESTKAIGIIDLSTGEVAVSMAISTFEFPNKLMQEHFNDNYLESDKYPRATLTGSIENWESCKAESGETNCSFTGEVEIHNVKKPLNSTLVFNWKNSQLVVSGAFDIRVTDHEIEIPKIVVKKIAEVVEVSARFEFQLTQ
jgi:hypothetical protein